MPTVIVPVTRYLEGTQEVLGPKYIGGYYKSKYPDLRFRMPQRGLHRFCLWFMIVEVFVVAGGDAAQLAAFLAEPDVEEIDGTMTGRKRNALVAVAEEAGLTLSDTSTEAALIRSLHQAEDAKRQTVDWGDEAVSAGFTQARTREDMNP